MKQSKAIADKSKAIAKRIIRLILFLWNKSGSIVLSDQKPSIILNYYLKHNEFMKTSLNFYKKNSLTNRIDTPFIKTSENSFSKTLFCPTYIYRGALSFYKKHSKDLNIPIVYTLTNGRVRVMCGNKLACNARRFRLEFSWVLF